MIIGKAIIVPSPPPEPNKILDKNTWKPLDSIHIALWQFEKEKYLNDVKFSVNSYTMNMPSLAAGIAAIEDDKYFKDILKL